VAIASSSSSPAARRCSGRRGRRLCTPLMQASERGWSRSAVHPPQPNFHQLRRNKRPAEHMRRECACDGHTVQTRLNSSCHAYVHARHACVRCPSRCCTLEAGAYAQHAHNLQHILHASQRCSTGFEHSRIKSRRLGAPATHTPPAAAAAVVSYCPESDRLARALLVVM
jgi:hypothetical protein